MSNNSENNIMRKFGVLTDSADVIFRKQKFKDILKATPSVRLTFMEDATLTTPLAPVLPVFYLLVVSYG